MKNLNESASIKPSENKFFSHWGNALKARINKVVFYDLKEVDSEQWCDDVDHLRGKEKQHEKSIQALKVVRAKIKLRAAELEQALMLENKKEDLKYKSFSHLRRVGLRLKTFLSIKLPAFDQLDVDELLLWEDSAIEKCMMAGVLPLLIWGLPMIVWKWVLTDGGSGWELIAGLILSLGLSAVVYAATAGGPLYHLSHIVQLFTYKREVKIRQQQELLKDTLRHSLEHRLMGHSLSKTTDEHIEVLPSHQFKNLKTKD